MSEMIIVSERDFSVRAREVIRELGKNAYVLVRVSVKGPHFPHRDAYPFVRIVSAEGRRGAESLIAEVSQDQKELRGYFPVDVRLDGRVEFGYASEVLGSIPFEPREPERLNRERIAERVREVTTTDLGPFKTMQRQ